MTPSISISQIKYVLSLERTRSFSDAADACFVTQSTLSTMIKKLENQIELKIFDRKTKPLSLTLEGDILIKQFKVLYHEYENLTDLIQTTKDVLSGTLKIGIIPTLAPFLLPLFLDDLVSKYPKVNFIIHEITTNEIVHLLKLRELDVGVLSIPIDDNALEQKTLFKEDFLVYDTNKSDKQKKVYSVDDIEVSRLWLLEESHCLTNQIGKICHLKKKSNLNQNLEFKSGSILSLLQMVNMHSGLTLLPRLASMNKTIIEEKYLYPLKKPCPAREIGFLYHPTFAKRGLLNIFEAEIMTAIKPVLSKIKQVEIVRPI